MSSRALSAALLALPMTAVAGLWLATGRTAPLPPPYASDAAIPRPALWGKGVISTRDDELGAQLVPGRRGTEVFYTKSVPRSQLYTILVSRFTGGRWQAPEVAPFSGTWRDFDPALSPDGTRLFFISDRPHDGKPAGDYDIWSVERAAAGGWSAPRPLAGTPNSPGAEHFASATRDGTLYFTSDRPGGKGAIDVWRSRWVDGRYAAAENLGDNINRPGWANIEAWVAPDESFLLVGAFGHQDSLGDSDLYVSYRQDASWGPLRNLGPAINSPARDYSPRVSPDGRYLFFASERGLPTAAHRPRTYRDWIAAVDGTLNGLGNIYQVDLKAALPPR
jgi:Tol biopolymer transport system component